MRTVCSIELAVLSAGYYLARPQGLIDRGDSACEEHYLAKADDLLALCGPVGHGCLFHV